MQCICPVCKREYSQNLAKCEVCGFSDDLGIYRLWLVFEDAKNWLDTKVTPYRVKLEFDRSATFVEAHDFIPLIRKE